VVHNIAMPYFDEPEKVAENINELRLRRWCSSIVLGFRGRLWHERGRGSISVHRQAGGFRGGYGLPGAL